MGNNLEKNIKIMNSHWLKGGPAYCRERNIASKLCPEACPEETVARYCNEKNRSIPLRDCKSNCYVKKGKNTRCFGFNFTLRTETYQIVQSFKGKARASMHKYNEMD